ncbi:hypothetical protein CM19_00520 [Candidatus Acidianus copahuensis]|uniref:Uncharacterized protein n=1 Tax=Candidatus Acidianus copahuensis TaxID=1160895 RepID=A0A031LX63_9CREN|nr:hypothetical protein CM19_00520 [Candidatus Acidianus copahuensis]
MKKYFLFLIPLIISATVFVITNAITIPVTRSNVNVANITPNETKFLQYALFVYTVHVHSIDPLLATAIAGVVSFVVVFFVARKVK